MESVKKALKCYSKIFQACKSTELKIKEAQALDYQFAKKLFKTWVETYVSRVY
jgi:hypothetical protein